ncbi:hypothetical protein PPACK8108_LOCUS26135 [Phakopsora pachyrhizi]|uniref:Uncharacterized protein n=1 Tax=Phakopsora pachyrhizi TaxID=170000 RepID=A0AAV0BYQ6_PHAPC|nr:hypothetical protein PPACK8108_LOCUS26135 [Phakopsora pachyrhizi]
MGCDDAGTSIGQNDFALEIHGNETIKHVCTNIMNIIMLYKGIIFARISPYEKQELVEHLQKIYYTVDFCGNVGNECEVLKGADVGLLLSNVEATVVAPFTS